MKKATKKDTSRTSPAKEPKESIRAVPPAQLGTKRACPKCGTKFYDFGKMDLVCPKCDAKFSAEELSSVRLAPAPKKAAPKPAAAEGDGLPPGAEELASSEGEDVIESVDDLGDDEDEEIVEDLVDEDEEEQEF